MVRQPGFGSTGPEAGYLTFGNTIEGMSGLSSLMGYVDGPPMMMSNAFGDPVSGLTGTVAVLAALAARERDGRGRVMECAQLEGFLPMVSEGLIEYQRTGLIPPRRGNTRAGHAASGVFPCEGEDEWVAVDCVDELQWAALAARCGLRGDDRASAIAAWTCALSRDQVVDACLAVGVAAAGVATEAECSSTADGLVRVLAAVERGCRHPPVSGAADFNGGWRRPWARHNLGQHNIEVFTAWGWTPWH
jgi:crotonobetainyl-CoA:carnitine CoA-transferase CaiB-like acyl-CoA transferase